MQVIRQDPSRASQWGEKFGMGLTAGITDRFKQQGMAKLMAILSQPGVTPQKALQAASSFTNPWSRQGALEALGQMMPHLKPMIVPAGASVVGPGGKTIREPEFAPQKPSAVKDVDYWWVDKEGKMQKRTRQIPQDQIPAVEARLIDMGVSLGKPEKEELSKRRKQGGVDKKKAYPGTREYKALVKAGYTPGEKTQDWKPSMEKPLTPQKAADELFNLKKDIFGMEAALARLEQTDKMDALLAKFAPEYALNTKLTKEMKDRLEKRIKEALNYAGMREQMLLRIAEKGEGKTLPLPEGFSEEYVRSLMAKRNMTWDQVIRGILNHPSYKGRK